ncbi:MAG: chemotaxis protein CheR [Thiobacillus sp.]|nr:chemotaxis protein CheR [Thiobacillus sp.]
MTPARRPNDNTKTFAFTPRDFARVRELIYRQAGIALSESKQEMVYSRLARRLRAKGLNSFESYLDALESDRSGEEWEAFINALTTNLTSFFREGHHFPLLAEHARQAKAPLSIWCAASSTGEEPYSIAMTLCETFDTLSPPVSVVATDIDTRVLEIASNGVYAADRLDKMPRERVKRFFLKGKGGQEGLVRVRPELRRLIEFRPLNLLGTNWPLKGPFDVIFCRNVMIYFDKPTQSQILSRFAPLMKPDGLLFAGHSENFAYASESFTLRGKTVYELAARHRVRAVRAGA